MSELNPSLSINTSNIAPVLGIGGLGSIKQQSAYYAPLLYSSNSNMTTKDRFLPIPDKGLSTFPEMFGQLEEEFITAVERLGEPATIFGHSLGGYFATELALHHPEKVLAVTCLAGVQDGIKELTLAGKALKYLLGSPETAKELLHDSDRMINHRQRIKNGWPAHVPLHLLVATHDILIPTPQGLELELPNGNQPERGIVVPIIPRLGFGIREKTNHLDNVKELRSVLPAEHLDIPVNLAVILHSRQVRRTAAFTTRAESAIVYLPTNNPDLLTDAVAA